MLMFHHCRYFFKAPSDEFDSGVVHEEIQSDNQILPLWEGKIVGKVEKKEWTITRRLLVGKVE